MDIEKVAEIYAEAHRNLALSKIADSMGVESTPEGYGDALLSRAGYQPLEKEAVLGAMGGAITRGAATLAKSIPKTMPGARGGAAKGLNWVRNNKKTVGGIAAGLGAGGAASAAAGAAQKRG